MKNIFFLAVAFFFGYQTAFAQLEISGKSAKIETIGKMRAGSISINKHGSVYYLSLTTTNSYDNNVIFYLGESKQAALLSCDDLLKIYDMNSTESVTVKDCRGYQFRITKHGGAGKGSITFKEIDAVQAGTCTLHRFELANAKKKLESYNE